MPTYVYQVVTEDGSDGETFEVVQKMSDPPLSRHPQTGRPVRRVIQTPNIAGRWSDAAAKHTLSDKNLDRLGFSKYQRSDSGQFEKRAGPGPKTIGTGE